MDRRDFVKTLGALFAVGAGVQAVHEAAKSPEDNSQNDVKEAVAVEFRLHDSAAGSGGPSYFTGMAEGVHVNYYAPINVTYPNGDRVYSRERSAGVVSFDKLTLPWDLLYAAYKCKQPCLALTVPVCDGTRALTLEKCDTYQLFWHTKWLTIDKYVHYTDVTIDVEGMKRDTTATTHRPRLHPDGGD